jgi:hypothetical protein
MITNAGSVLCEGISLQSAGTVVNAGSVAGAVNGIYLLAGGGVTNQSSASISGYTGVFNGVEGTLTLLNAGNITGNTTSVNGAGVDLDDGGVITNQGGTIGAYYGIYAFFTAASVVNTGRIAGNTTSPKGAGIDLKFGGSVTNLTGAIAGFNAIESSYTTTVVNGGSITGTKYAVDFSSGVMNRLIVDPGAMFSGTVTGGNAIGAPTVSTFGRP